MLGIQHTVIGSRRIRHVLASAHYKVANLPSLLRRLAVLHQWLIRFRGVPSPSSCSFFMPSLFHLHLLYMLVPIILARFCFPGKTIVLFF